jgi:hypothetical protein
LRTEPAWNQQWNKTVSAAKKEGKVVVFGPAGEMLRNALMASFKKSFPEITLEYAGGRAVEQATRIKAERDGGVYSVDVFIGGVVTMMDMGGAGALERIDSALILPEVKDPNIGATAGTVTNHRRVTRWCLQPAQPPVFTIKQLALRDRRALKLLKMEG